MLLTIDAGNTQTVIGLFKGNELTDHWRIGTVVERTADELALMVQQFLGFHGFSLQTEPGPRGARGPGLEGGSIDGVAISSGVPSVTAELRAMTARYFGFPALVLEPGVRTGMPILYDNPKEVGPDRIANAVAAYDLYGGPSIVVDFGTANTI
jgi:type III pantothenate kinase